MPAQKKERAPKNFSAAVPSATTAYASTWNSAGKLRWTRPAAYFALLTLIGCLLPTCGNADQEGRYEITLTEEILTNREPRLEPRLDTLEGTLDLRRARARVDTAGTIESWPGAVRYDTLDGRPVTVLTIVDSLDGVDSYVRVSGRNYRKATIPAGNISLGGDSLRLGIVRIGDRGNHGRPGSDSTVYPDYLVLGPAGSGEMQIDLNADNVGPISRQTLFRVDRNYFYLESVDTSRRKLVVRALDDPLGLDPAAELDLAIKRISVQRLDGTPASVKPSAGRRMGIYFFQLGGGPDRGAGVIKLDSMVRASRRVGSEAPEVVLINRIDSATELEAFVRKHEISLPVYVATANTCRKLNCSPRLPYWVVINERGRVVNFNAAAFAL